MDYVMSAGDLYERDSRRLLLRMRGLFAGEERRILSPDGALRLKTMVRRSGADARSGSVRNREYVMQDENGTDRAVARPDYADGNDPDRTGWPVCRLPRVDRAQVRIDGQCYRLVMENCRSYVLSDESGRSLVRIVHRGAPGGWDICSQGSFRPELLAGLFIFCRYIEKENEFTVV